MQAPDFLGEDTSAEASKLVPDLALEESALPYDDPRLVRFREAKENRDKASRDLSFVKRSGMRGVAVMQAREKYETAEQEYKDAKKALPERSSSVGKTGPTKSVLGFTAGRRTRRRRNLRKRNRKTRKWTSSATRKRN